MKILIVAERYWPEVGAAPSRLANMAEGLKENGCDVEVLTGLPNYPKGKIFGLLVKTGAETPKKKRNATL